MFDCFGCHGGEGFGDKRTEFADVLGRGGVDVCEKAECEALFFWVFGGEIEIIRW